MVQRKDQDFGLKRTIHSIFDGADFPDDVREAIAQANKEHPPAQPKRPNIPDQAPSQDLTIKLTSPSSLEPDLPLHTPGSTKPVVLPVIESQAHSDQSAESQERGVDSNLRHDSISKLKKALKCPKNFECCETGFTVLCKTRLTFGGRVVECVGKDQKKCRFRRSVFGKGICGCRMRQYIARTLGL